MYLNETKYIPNMQTVTKCTKIAPKIQTNEPKCNWDSGA